MASAYLHLADGTMIEGESFGYAGESSCGEVVFTTGMIGYCQSLTDPSFAGQILAFTYPLIGNYGVPRAKKGASLIVDSFESERIWVKGVVVSEHCVNPSHYLSVQTLSSWLARHKIPGIAGVDTRVLTQKLRSGGVMRGKISSKAKIRWDTSDETHWVSRVSYGRHISYEPIMQGTSKHIVLIDCGVKHGIIRMLLSRGFRVTRIPWDQNPLDVKGVDGVVCSNGPGDPKTCVATIANIRRVIASGMPFLGICLWHQLFALAIGADTYKLSYGHRGLNQPCRDVTTGKGYITSQNHGYAVDRQTIPKDYAEWFVNLNDQTNEGIRHTTKPMGSVQFHPEGNPGPLDTEWIVDTLL